MRRPPTALAYATLIATFTGYLLLDTFVLQCAYETGVTTGDATEAFAAAQERLGTTDVATGTGDSTTTTTTTGDTNADTTTTGADAGTDGATTTTGGRGRHGAGPGRRSRSGSGSGGTTKGSTSASTTTTDATVTASATPYDDYDDGNVHISLKEYTVAGTKAYVADVTVTSAEHLLAAFANGTFGKNVTATTSETAASVGAVLAINGDYYGVQEAGYVIRNGTAYRTTTNGDTDLACIYADGTMRIVNTSEATASELVDAGVWQAFSFGPALVRDGNVAVTAADEVGRAMASNPRTAIGMVSANHYLLVVSDGRTSESAGLSLAQLATFMQGLGACVAYNLDGGGSSTMYYQGRVVNNPTTTGNSVQERGVSDIVYVK